MSYTPSPPAKQVSRDDLLIESTILYWWSRRRFIITILLAAIALFAVVLLIIPKAYRAQASVIIMPPRFVPEVRTQPLTVTTAQSLLETHELYQQVIRSLRRNRDLVVRISGEENPSVEKLQQVADLLPQEISSASGATPDEAEALAEMDLSELEGLIEFSDDELQDMTVDSVSETLSSEETVEKKTASELTYSPVLQLHAIADSGNKAQVLANIWAGLFEEKYESVTRGQTQRLYESLENQQIAGQQELENIQKILVEFSLENNLDLLERQIAEYTESMTSYSRQLVNRSNELVNMRAQMVTLVQLVRALEQEDGGWLGGAQVDTFSTDSEHIVYEDVPHLEINDTVPSVTLMRREALRSRVDLIRALDMAYAFNERNPITLLTAEEERLRQEFLEQKTEYRNSLVKAEVLEMTLQDISTLLSATSQSVVLATALPDEVIGQALLSERRQNIEQASLLQLQTEQLNPFWTVLINQRAEASRELAEAQAAISELSAVLPQKEKELRSLSNRVFQAKQAEETVTQRVERYQQLNENLFTHYTQMKNQLFSVSWRVTLLEEEINSLRTGLAATRVELEAFREEYEGAAAQVEIINLRKSAVAERANLLTQKLQESLVAIGEQVSDVTIASKAVAPTRHFFPPRTILLALMTFLTAAVVLGGMSRRRYLELAAARDTNIG